MPDYRPRRLHRPRLALPPGDVDHPIDLPSERTDRLDIVRVMIDRSTIDDQQGVSRARAIGVPTIGPRDVLLQGRPEETADSDIARPDDLAEDGPRVEEHRQRNPHEKCALVPLIPPSTKPLEGVPGSVQ